MPASFQKRLFGEIVFLKRGNKVPPKYTRVENSPGKEKTEERFQRKFGNFPFFVCSSNTPMQASVDPTFPKFFPRFLSDSASCKRLRLRAFSFPFSSTPDSQATVSIKTGGKAQYLHAGKNEELKKIKC